MAKITTGYARQLAKNYRENKLGKKLLVEDTNAVWFSKETILDALGLDNTIACKYSGLKFYFGAYENASSAPANYPKNRDYCNKLTLIIVKTKQIVDGMAKDALDEPTAKPGYPTKPGGPAGGSLDDDYVYNDGQLCPPPRCDHDGLLNF